MASEIERLPDLEGFLKFASNPDWLRLRLAYVSYPTARRETRAATTGVPEAAGDLAPRAVLNTVALLIAPASPVKSHSLTRKARKSPAKAAQSRNPPPQDAGVGDDAAAVASSTRNRRGRPRSSRRSDAVPPHE